LVDDREPGSYTCGQNELYSQLAAQQSVSPSMFSMLEQTDENRNGYWSQICTPSTVCVPSSPDLGDLGAVEKEAVISDMLDYCLLNM